MWDKIQYGLLYTWIKAHAILPLWALYVLSDIFYFLSYKVVGYRKKIVRRNMKASFPDKTEAELRQLEKEFYHHFADYIVETIKLAHISHEEVQRRAVINNPEVIDRVMDEGHPCVIMMLGHYGNWEWYTASTTFFRDASLYQVYRPLKNKAFDRLFIKLRTQYGSLGIKKNETIRDVIKLNQEKKRSIIILLADQTPSKANIHYWTSFLNQDSAVFTGGERMARKLDLPVIYADAKKIKRGYYTVDMKLITDKAKETPEYWITEQYTRLMERSILRNPAYWLWSHKRWKYKRETK